MADTRTVFVIVGFDSEGNAVEMGDCEPVNAVAEALIAEYTGPLVNLHWVVRQVPADAPPTAAPDETWPPPASEVPQPHTQDVTLEQATADVAQADEPPKPPSSSWPP